MALKKITEAQMAANGVCAAPDILNGTAAENKAVFDRMMRNIVAPAYNACVDAVNALGDMETGIKQAEEERKTEETNRQTAEAAREAKETGYVAQAEAAANAAEQSKEAAAESAGAAAAAKSAAKISEEAAAESARRAAQAAVGQIPDGSLEPEKFSGTSRSMMVRDNLLINSIFANKDAIVDQRGGYVVPPGVNYYESTAGGTAAGTTTGYVKVTPTPNVANSGMLTIDGKTYYCAWSKVVRGYTGAGYTIDRWRSVSSGIVVLVEDDGVLVTNTGNTTGYIKQTIEQDATGFVFCMSILTDDNLYSNYGTGVNSKNAVSIGDIRKTGVWEASFQYDGLRFYVAVAVRGGQRVKLKAAKLELGDQQTLAHQDENGNWVLNEIPDYGETLRKCRQYYRKSFDGASPVGTNTFLGFIAGTAYSTPSAVYFETPMRATPNVKIYNPVSGAQGSVRKWDGSGNVDGCSVVYSSKHGFGIRSNGVFTVGEMYAFHYEASEEL